jgi:thioester reductase-like protein
MEWNPHFKVDMQPSSDEEGAFELVLFADATTEKMSALNHNLPGIPEYRTKDLFKQHPEKPGLWRYSGRRDDIIVLSNGEKFNPVPMELMIQGHPALSGALVVGMGRIQAGLLVEVKPEFHEHGTQDSSLMEEIWPVVEMANQLVPGQGRIMPNKILVSGMTKPFIRAGKGTIVRRLTERLYEPEIESLYAAQYNASVRSLPSLQPTMKPVFEMSAVLHFVRSIIMDAFPEMKQLSDDDNLFSYGLDSLKMSQLVDHLKTALKATSKIEETYWIDSRLIYQNPSILKLSDVVYQFLNTGTQTGVGEETTSRTKKMDDLVSRYTEGLINNPGRKIRSDEPSIVAVIGSTGYLGPHIVASLLKYPSISKIYCLNRGKDAEQRTISALIEIGHLPTEDIQRLRFMVTDLGEPELGLEETNYAQLNSVVDAIIFNSWYPNFSLPLQSFEFPFLRGLRAIIDWSASSERHPLIAFVSSIAAVGNWPKVYPHQQIIPEKHAEDSNVALNMGYGESKCVAEQILARASKVAGVDVAIIRAGQIGGTASPNLGLWPVQGWLFALAKTANSLGVFPAQVSPLDWIPVDAFAAAAANIARSHGHFKTVRVFNVVHPNPVPWNLFFSTLQKRFGLQAAEVSLPQFLDRLHHATSGSDAKSLSDLETMKIYDFLRSLGDGREGDMKCQIDNAASVSEAIPPITEELLVAWLKTWDLKLESVKLNM